LKFPVVPLNREKSVLGNVGSSRIFLRIQL